jgi:hypothetical protein
MGNSQSFDITPCVTNKYIYKIKSVDELKIKKLLNVGLDKKIAITLKYFPYHCYNTDIRIKYNSYLSTSYLYPDLKKITQVDIPRSATIYVSSSTDDMVPRSIYLTPIDMFDCTIFSETPDFTKLELSKVSCSVNNIDLDPKLCIETYNNRAAMSLYKKYKNPADYIENYFNYQFELKQNTCEYIHTMYIPFYFVEIIDVEPDSEIGKTNNKFFIINAVTNEIVQNNKSYLQNIFSTLFS